MLVRTLPDGKPDAPLEIRSNATTVGGYLWHGSYSETIRSSSALFDYGTVTAYNHPYGVFAEFGRPFKAPGPLPKLQTGVVAAWII